ncbi:DJ-1/PfpI family protein [Streptomyces liangshanensis]|uniref:DJ-1/PfpI family protein n=1 Tax=Streptomyces liangshanensis TaxID=2717324 RepID=UPI0036DD9B4A
MSKVLIMLTGARVWSQNDGTQRPTGFWGEEFTVPHELLTEAGVQLTLATPGGAVPVVDELSLSAESNNGDADAAARFRSYLDRVSGFLGNPSRLEDIDPAEYDAVLVPGGHGPMQDLAVNADAGRILAAMLPDGGKTVAALCHGQAAFLSAGDADGKWIFTGRRMTSFTDEEEHVTGLDANAPWLLESRLRAGGAEVTGGPAWRSHVVVDGNLITGQNPASGAAVARKLIEALGARKTATEAATGTATGTGTPQDAVPKGTAPAGAAPRSVEEANKAIVRQAYELAAANDLEALFEVRAADYRLTLPDGHPVPGTWTGRDADAARERIFAALGADGVTTRELVADGPHRVIALVEPTGLDGAGDRWSMLLAELFRIEDGKITEIEPFWWDIVELNRIADSRIRH